MAKELPYFRFTAQEWQNGDITLMDYESQGVFTNVCCFYWLSDCSITLAKLKLRLPTAINIIESLLKNGIIKHDAKTDFLEIEFLNEQFDVLSEKRKKRQEAGSKGGKAKSSNAKAMLKQKPSYKDKEKEKDNDNLLQPETTSNSAYSFDMFWKDYDKKQGLKDAQKKYSKLSEEIRLKIKEHIPKYKKSVSDQQFRKNPVTYINQEAWNDEVIIAPKPPGNPF
jgi:hypothetical protein